MISEKTHYESAAADEQTPETVQVTWVEDSGERNDARRKGIRALGRGVVGKLAALKNRVGKLMEPQYYSYGQKITKDQYDALTAQQNQQGVEAAIAELYKDPPVYGEAPQAPGEFTHSTDKGDYQVSMEGVTQLSFEPLAPDAVNKLSPDQLKQYLIKGYDTTLRGMREKYEQAVEEGNQELADNIRRDGDYVQQLKDEAWGGQINLDEMQHRASDWRARGGFHAGNTYDQRYAEYYKRLGIQQ